MERAYIRLNGVYGGSDGGASGKGMELDWGWRDKRVNRRGVRESNYQYESKEWQEKE